MDILAGRRYGAGVSGSIHLNGNAVDGADMRRLAGCARFSGHVSDYCDGR